MATHHRAPQAWLAALTRNSHHILLRQLRPPEAATEGAIRSLRVFTRGDYSTWCRAALEAEEVRVKAFIAYWRERNNPRLVRRGDQQLGWIWSARRKG